MQNSSRVLVKTKTNNMSSTPLKAKNSQKTKSERKDRSYLNTSIVHSEED